MAKSKGGVNGSLSGKLGNTVASSWNGIEYFRSAPKKRSTDFTPGEKRGQANMKTVHQWLQPLLDVVRVGFKDYSRTNYGYNAAKSYNYKNALVQDGENPWMDPAQVKVSFGDLGISKDLAFEIDENQVLQFTWDTSIDREMGIRDQVMLVAYDPETRENNYTTSGGFRMGGSANLNLSGFPTGKYHVYAAFVAEDRCRQSHSTYLGAVEI